MAQIGSISVGNLPALVHQLFPIDEEIAESYTRWLKKSLNLGRSPSTPVTVAVARLALDAGASMINDVSGLRDSAMLELSYRSTMLMSVLCIC